MKISLFDEDDLKAIEGAVARGLNLKALEDTIARGVLRGMRVALREGAVAGHKPPVETFAEAGAFVPAAPPGPGQQPPPPPPAPPPAAPPVQEPPPLVAKGPEAKPQHAYIMPSAGQVAAALEEAEKKKRPPEADEVSDAVKALKEGKPLPPGISLVPPPDGATWTPADIQRAARERQQGEREAARQAPPEPVEKRRKLYELIPSRADRPQGFITTDECRNIIGREATMQNTLNAWIRNKEVEAVIVMNYPGPPTKGCEGGRVHVSKESLIARNQQRIANAAAGIGRQRKTA